MSKQKIRVNPILSAQIKEIRKRRNKTQAELAELLDMTDQTIRKYESGQYGVPHSSVIAISKALNCPIEFLLGNTDCDSPEAYQEEQTDIKEAVELAKIYMEEKAREYRLTTDFLKTFLSCELKETYLREKDGSFSPLCVMTMPNGKVFKFHSRIEMEDFFMNFYDDVKKLLRYHLLDFFQDQNLYSDSE